MRILHITPHLGGGIGSAYCGVTKPEAGVRHEIILLEPPVNRTFIERITQNGCRVSFRGDIKDERRLIEDSDIIQINWWHHPVMCDYLYNFPDIPVRPVSWIHVSGCDYPYLRADFLRCFDYSMFTTPYTYENPEIKAMDEDYLSSDTGVVYGMSDLSRVKAVRRKRQENFTVGYVGTIDTVKMHSDFIEYCANVRVPAEFTLVGDDSEKDALLRQCKDYEKEIKLSFTGFVSDIESELKKMDAFGYLLNPKHYGTTENALLEAMAAGLPVIAMNQSVEKFIIKDGVTGLLVSNKDEYANAVKWVYENPQKAGEMGNAARESVLSTYGIEENQKRLMNIYSKILTKDKRPFSVKSLTGNSPGDWFLYAVRAERDYFINDTPWLAGHIFKGKSKSSVYHYLSVFPDDERLKRWAGALEHPNP